MHCLSADDTKISFLKDFSRCVLLDKGKDLAQGIRVSKMTEFCGESHEGAKASSAMARPSRFHPLPQFLSSHSHLILARTILLLRNMN